MKLLDDNATVVAQGEKIAYDADARGWRVDELLLSDPEKVLSLQLQSVLSPVEFKLRFMPSERIAIRAARDENAVIFDFLELMEDPRLTQVDLSLQSTIEAVAYLEDQGFIAAGRALEILAPVT